MDIFRYIVEFNIYDDNLQLQFYVQLKQVCIFGNFTQGFVLCYVIFCKPLWGTQFRTQNGLSKTDFITSDRRLHL